MSSEQIFLHFNDFQCFKAKKGDKVMGCWGDEEGFRLYFWAPLSPYHFITPSLYHPITLSPSKASY